MFCEAFWAARSTQHFRNETVHATLNCFAYSFLLLAPYLLLLNGSSVLNMRVIFGVLIKERYD